MKNCVWTALARADRGSDPPEKLPKQWKKQSTNRHTYKPDFPPKPPKSTSEETPQTNENLKKRSRSRPSLPKPLYLTS